MSASSFGELEGMPLTNGEPAFDEPWQAQAFAMVVALNESDALDWSEWARMLGEEIAVDQARPYWDCWLAALQTFMMKTGIASKDKIDRRTDAWHEAARHTPHGQPIVLKQS